MHKNNPAQNSNRAIHSLQYIEINNVKDQPTQKLMFKDIPNLRDALVGNIYIDTVQKINFGSVPTIQTPLQSGAFTIPMNYISILSLTLQDSEGDNFYEDVPMWYFNQQFMGNAGEFNFKMQEKDNKWRYINWSKSFIKIRDVAAFDFAQNWGIGFFVNYIPEIDLIKMGKREARKKPLEPTK